MGERTATRLTAVVLAGALLPLAGVATAAHGSAAPALPKPTGSYSVGATDLWLTDNSRADPWVPTTPYRELMVTVWYPADARTGPAQRYMTAADSAALLAGKHVDVSDPAILSTIRTNALKDAPVAGRRHSLPLVVLSPGYTFPRMTLSHLAEDLASHGYVVAAIDHTGETYSTTFPDGHVVACTTCAIDGERTFFGHLYASRAVDVSFVLDRLTGARPAWSGASVIDPTRIGMSGHSAGGASVFAAMVHDPRIDAGIDIDGTTNTGDDTAYLVPSSGLDRPFMVLANQEDVPGRNQWLDHDYAALTGWKRWFTVAGAVHQSFTDIPLFSDAIGVPNPATIDPLRGIEITRRLNLAMFDTWLRGRPQRILDDPTGCYPEVTSL